MTVNEWITLLVIVNFVLIALTTLAGFLILRNGLAQLDRNVQQHVATFFSDRAATHGEGPPHGEH